MREAEHGQPEVDSSLVVSRVQCQQLSELCLLLAAPDVEGD